MKKFLVILLSIILLISTSINLFATEENSIVAKIVNPNITIDGVYANDNLDNPIISYNDRTYISIRDFVKYFGCDVLWNERTGNIHIFYGYKDDVITTTKTASQMALAILEQNYSDKITENTKYYTYKTDADKIGGKNTFFITEVIFDYESIENSTEKPSNLQFDVIISICAETGSIEIEENVTNVKQYNWFENSKSIQET